MTKGTKLRRNRAGGTNAYKAFFLRGRPFLTKRKNGTRNRMCFVTSEIVNIATNPASLTENVSSSL
jgi:hypothetical protein